MKADETRAWGFTAPLEDNSEVQCPDCDKWSALSTWERGYVDCETCGDHASMDCPECGAAHDHVWAKPFSTRLPETR